MNRQGRGKRTGITDTDLWSQVLKLNEDVMVRAAVQIPSNGSRLPVVPRCRPDKQIRLHNHFITEENSRPNGIQHPTTSSNHNFSLLACADSQSAEKPNRQSRNLKSKVNKASLTLARLNHPNDEALHHACLRDMDASDDKIHLISDWLDVSEPRPQESIFDVSEISIDNMYDNEMELICDTSYLMPYLCNPWKKIIRKCNSRQTTQRYLN